MVSDAALEAHPHVLLMEELDIVPTVDQLSKTINYLTREKAPGKDGIPPEVLKSGKSAHNVAPALAPVPLLDVGICIT